MFDTVRRVILSGIDIQRGILDYMEQLVEAGTASEEGETPLDNLRNKLGNDLQHFREVVHDVVKNTLQTGLHQIDDKLDILNEHISALEKEKMVCRKPAPQKAKKTATTSKPAVAKKRKAPPQKTPAQTSNEPIVDG